MADIITRVYETVSYRASELLKREEGLDVEFKQSLDALDVTDVVAFANSATGGAILVGIREEHQESGRQRAKIHGVRAGDKAKMLIVSKVNNVTPQLDVEIYVENASRKPFYRIEIPSGPNKPYCSASGAYKIRDDGYSKPLLPEAMLQMHLERESEQFMKRFTKATEMLEDEILGIRQRALGELDQLEKQIAMLSEKTDAILSDLGIENPVEKRRRETLKKITALLEESGVESDVIEEIIEPFVSKQ